MTGWIMNRNATAQLLSVNTSVTKVIHPIANNPDCYSNDRVNLPLSTWCETYTSLATLRAAVLKPGTQAVLYDNERWSFTPFEEQTNPVGSASAAAAYVHGLGMQLVFTPAIDLIYVLAPPGKKDKYAAFLATNLYAQAAASGVDVIEIQAQQLQGTPAYASFVASAVAQIRTVNSTIPVFAGMSSDPLGNPVSAAHLLKDYKLTAGLVNGYWMNIPVQSPQCPACGDGNPLAAKRFLTQVLTL